MPPKKPHPSPSGSKLTNQAITLKGKTMEITPTVRELPNIKLSKRTHRIFNEWTARIEAEGLHVGQTVKATRITTDSRDFITSKWEEDAVIIDLRNFDALVEFADGSRGSSGLGFHTEAK